MKSELKAGYVLLAQALREVGVSHLYSVPAVPIYDSVAACVAAGMRVIGTRHQQGAALMAAAQNYMAGRQVAAILASPGASASNALTGAVVARDNCWPLLVIVAAVAHREKFSGQFMCLDTPALYGSVTKSATSVRSASTLPAVIAEAAQCAMAGRPGPVLVEIPADVLAERCFCPPTSVQRPSEEPRIATSDLDSVIGALLLAKRPLLIVGKGTRWAEPFADLATLVDRLALPFVTSPIARGYVSDAHPLGCNDFKWAVQREADVVLVVGARFDWTFRFGTELRHDATIIQVDIDATEIGRNRATQIGIVGDAGTFLRGLLARLPEQAIAPEQINKRHAWVEQLRRRHDSANQRAATAPTVATATLPAIAPHVLASAVHDAMPANAISILDANLVMATCERHIPVHRPLGRLTPGTSGCMGTGIPFAIGAKLQCPERPVVVVCGDFAFGLNAFEMETAVRHNVPIMVVVANNDGNAGALRQRMMFPSGHAEHVAMYQPGIRYEKIVEAFGGYGEHVERAEDVGPALRRALACGRPACINVAIDPDAPFPRG